MRTILVHGFAGSFIKRHSYIHLVSSIKGLVLIILFISSEFVLNENNIFPYNCPKKTDFIQKGLGKLFFSSEK